MLTYILIQANFIPTIVELCTIGITAVVQLHKTSGGEKKNSEHPTFAKDDLHIVKFLGRGWYV